MMSPPIRFNEAMLEQLPHQPGDELHVDFDRVGYLTTEGIAKVVTLHRRLKEQHCRLVLRNVAPFVSDLFHVTRLDTVIDVRGEDAALTA
jgi:anti-anti-sigma regulatory factor